MSEEYSTIEIVSDGFYKAAYEYHIKERKILVNVILFFCILFIIETILILYLMGCFK